MNQKTGEALLTTTERERAGRNANTATEATFPASTPLPRTGAELVAYWQREGVVGFRQDIEDAPAEARRLRQEAETERHPR
jgi:hypothetical protein